jgi:hypothetical protein
MRDQPGHMARVSLSVDWFLNALQGLGLLNNVLLFTASGLRPHAAEQRRRQRPWLGQHHFVAGGAVRGGDIYGRIPVTTIGTADEVGSGRLLPSTSVTELAANLGGWMGLTRSEQELVLAGPGPVQQHPAGLSLSGSPCAYPCCCSVCARSSSLASARSSTARSCSSSASSR